MGAGGRSSRIYTYFFLAGWLLGFVPVINTWNETDPVIFASGLLLLPLLTGFALWSLLAGGTMLRARLRGQPTPSPKADARKLVNGWASCPNAGPIWPWPC
jgi:hypothetical protein